jgi:hypothetical protein
LRQQFCMLSSNLVSLSILRKQTMVHTAVVP